MFTCVKGDHKVWKVKRRAEVGSQARRQGSISHLPQVGAITR